VTRRRHYTSKWMISDSFWDIFVLALLLRTRVNRLVLAEKIERVFRFHFGFYRRPPAVCRSDAECKSSPILWRLVVAIVRSYPPVETRVGFFSCAHLLDFVPVRNLFACYKRVIIIRLKQHTVIYWICSSRFESNRKLHLSVRTFFFIFVLLVRLFIFTNASVFT